MTDERDPWEPSPRPKRRVSDVEVSGVAEALGDHEMMTAWWYDPASGDVEMRSPEGYGDDDDDEDDDPRDQGMVYIDPEGSHAAYQDMVDFAEAVADPRPADLLIRAVEGRGAFRRFRDTLHEFPDLLEPWSAFSRACAETRAIRRLREFDLVEDDDVVAELDVRSAAADAVLAAIGTAPACRSSRRRPAGSGRRSWRRSTPVRPSCCCATGLCGRSSNQARDRLARRHVTAATRPSGAQGSREERARRQSRRGRRS